MGVVGRKIRIGRSSLSLAVAALAAWVGVAAAEEWRIDRWEQKVYYRYTFTAAAAGQASLRLTAVDEYEVFFNGTAVGVDGDWASMEEYAIDLQAGANHLAVRVDNRGLGNGSGLVVEIGGGEQVWTSNTSGLSEVWRWSGAAQEGSAWQTADVSEAEDWAPVQRGLLQRGGVAGWADTLGAEVIAGFPGGVAVGNSGGLTLRTVEGENLALAQSANRIEVFDGDASSNWTIEPDELNSSARVDLGIRRLLSGVRVFTPGANAGERAQNSVLGYAVQVSNDGFQWREVGALRGIVDAAQTEVAFEPLFSRFLRVSVIELDPLRRAQIAEVQVLGEGVAPAGAFTSAALDLGAARPKNFERLRWSGAVPDGTDLQLQFRSSEDGQAWSPWSAAVSAVAAELLVPEPRTFLQYRVNLATDFEDLGPRLDSLVIEFSDEIPASLAQARVQPNRAVVGRDTTFTYHLELDFGDGDLGIERLRIAMPSLAMVEQIDAPADVEVSETTILGDALEIVFVEPWRSAGALEVRFSARLLTNQFAFATRLFSPGGAALDAQEDVSSDPDSGTARSWSVRAFDAEGPLLSAVRAQPPVFTPNGDGVNDNTVIEFTLSRVSLPQDVEMRVFDLQGRLVRRLDDGPVLGGQYIRPPGGRDPSSSPGFWDGRDNGGEIVPPGIYLVRVRARLDQGERTETRTVAVVY